MEVFETALPGVGIRYDFETAAGDRLGVVVHRDSRREFALYDKEDPDACLVTIHLEPAEAAVLVELLGGTKVTERLSDLRHEVVGLSIEWVTIPESGALSGQTIGDGQIRTKTGASVVAVLRGETSIPGPGPDFVLEPGDVALIVGSVDGVQSASRLLAG